MKPRSGTAYEEICAAAREVKADLIVIATHGYTGCKHMLLGSTAERVVQHSLCPVLVVRLHDTHRNGTLASRTRTGFHLKKILVPIDFSECSEAASRYAALLAGDFNAELRLVHVINPHAYPFGDKYTALDPAELMRQTEDAAEEQLLLMAGKTNVPYTAEIRNGSPSIEICNAANQDVDLIVISTHGRTGLGHLLIGSVAERVVRHARCPVLVIPARRKSKRV
jgi:nucleotide-binding universal stress UspA family protein